MEIKIHNRSKIMRIVALIMFMTLVWAYAKLEWGVPEVVQKRVIQSRGKIISVDNKILARTEGAKRDYPQRTIAGQVIGMLGESAGLEGLENSQNTLLETGHDLRITIDTRVQSAAQAALAKAVPKHKGEFGSIVIIETRTGRLLASASYPNFDPNNWKNYNQVTWRNRPFIDVYEPGSTIKPLIVAAAINEGTTTPESLYSTPMKRKVGDSVINDVVPHPAELSTQEILRYSSNVGMSHIAEHFSYETMRKYLTAYGFGTGIKLTGLYTEKGRLQPLSKWGDLVRATNAFGQGMSCTTLQLATAYNVLANDGLYITPRLIENDLSDERATSRLVKYEVIKPEVARTVRKMLKTVIAEGIPNQAGLRGYDLAGKTGTAQVVINGKYSRSIYNSVFAGFFPAEAPQITMAVMVYGAKQEYHGSQLAAPIFREIAADILSGWGAVPKPIVKN